jgi:DNA polymerase-3 subunit alpha
MAFKPIACGFHSHSDNSLDGGSTVETKIKRAKELGRPADCLTDHGVMSGLASHYSACKKHGIKSIHGIEAYMADMFEPFKINEKTGVKQYQYSHLTIHFKTARAFQYFSQLTPKMEERAVVKWGERKPIMLFEELEDIANDVVIGSGCLVGAVQKYVKDGPEGIEKARKAYCRLRNIVPKGQFFVEMFPHIIDKSWQRPIVNKETGIIEKPGYFKPHECDDPECPARPRDIQRLPSKIILEWAKEFNDPIIISEDSHFAAPSDKLVQDIRIGNGKENWKFYNSYHMGTTDEWADNFKQQLDVTDRDIEEWVDNSYLFIDQFKDYKFKLIEGKDTDEWHLPKMENIYDLKEPVSSKTKLKELILKHGRMPGRDHPQYEEYVARLKREVAVLADNGKVDFLPYFFVFEDVCNWCQENGLLFNARGSAGGSLVLFLLGCSITDPIVHGLSFERFLTLGRIKSGSFPDVDMDFSSQDLVFDYIRQKYGEHFARISIQKPLKLKTSIKDIERDRFGYVRDETNAMTSMIPNIPQGVTDLQWLFGYEDETTGAHELGYIELEQDPGAILLRKYRDDNKDIWDTVLKCLGVTREKSVHACGLVIASKPVKDFMPLLNVSDELCTAYGPKDVEKVGGVKFDFLSVNKLKCLEITMKSIKERTGQTLVWEEFPHDDRVYEQVINKNPFALFQIDTNSMRPYVSKIRPNSIAQLSNILALVRPGALDAASPDPADNPEYQASGKASDVKVTSADFYVKCAKGQRKSYYIHPDLEPILGTSYGMNLFQEQTLQIARDVGGLDYEEAEALRRGIGKKDADLLKKELAKLKLRIQDHSPHWTDEQTDATLNMMKASARYSFNKSHSESYAIVTYNGAWLKFFYPLDFWKGELTVHAKDIDDVREYMKECGHLVLPIDVLKSHPTEWMIEGDKLRPPLSTLKGVGQVGQDLQRLINEPLDSFEKKMKKMTWKLDQPIFDELVREGLILVDGSQAFYKIEDGGRIKERNKAYKEMVRASKPKKTKSKKLGEVLTDEMG